MISKWFIPILGVIILAVSVPFFINSCDDFQTDDYSYAEAGVETGEGVTTGSVTLPLALFDDDITNVNYITSDLDDEDSVTATGYTTATGVLAVSGLTVSENRTLTVNYKTDALTGSNTAVGTLAGFWPLWLVLGGGLFVGARIWKH